MIRIKPLRKPRPPVPSELQLHVSVANFLRYAIRAPCYWTSVDAGSGKLSKAAAGRAKARGLRAGVPDILVFAPRAGGTLVLGIEIKSARGTLSPVQRATHDAMALAGVQCLTARSLDDVVDILRRADVPLHGRV